MWEVVEAVSYGLIAAAGILSGRLLLLVWRLRAERPQEDLEQEEDLTWLVERCMFCGGKIEPVEIGPGEVALCPACDPETKG